MAEIPFRPVRQLSEYKGKGASASREKGKAKGKHIEICEEAATCSAQDLSASNWEKINFFITGDKFRTFLDMPSFAPS